MLVKLRFKVSKDKTFSQMNVKTSSVFIQKIKHLSEVTFLEWKETLITTCVVGLFLCPHFDCLY